MAKRRTSRQRAASRKNILKAQKVSARKRRGIRKGVLVGVGTAAVLGTGIAALGRNYIHTVSRGGPRPSAFNPTYQLALPVGHSVTKVKRQKRAIPERKGVFKVNSEGTGWYVKRNRPNYDWHRRKGFVPGYEKKIRSKYDGMSERTQRRRRANRG